MKPCLFIATLLLCIACGSKKPDLTRTAITGFPTPVYEGTLAVTSGTILKVLPPQTVVYVQPDSIEILNLNLVKVFWNDTSGYVPANWLLEGGMLGVVDASPEHPVIISDDPGQQTPSGKTFTGRQLISFKKYSDDVSQVVYANEKDSSKPWFGYIAQPVISDSLSVTFFMAYTFASQKLKEGNTAPMEALKANTAFAQLPLYMSAFGGTAETQSPGGHHTDMEWVDANGSKLTGDAIPGKFELHYVWDDDSESDGNHLGDNLEQGTPECETSGTRSAKAYKMIFTPNQRMDVTFTCLIPMITNDEGPFTLTYQAVEPEKPYEFLITHRVYGVVCDETTFMVATSLGHKGQGMVHASCGD